MCRFRFFRALTADHAVGVCWKRKQVNTVSFSGALAKDVIRVFILKSGPRSPTGYRSLILVL